MLDSSSVPRVVPTVPPRSVLPALKRAAGSPAPRSSAPNSPSAGLPGRLVRTGPWLSDAEARLLVSRGSLLPVLPGIFCTGRPTPSLRAEALAALMRPGTTEHGVVQGRGAAWILGCTGRPERFDCTVGTRRGQALAPEETALLRQTFRIHQPYDVVRVGPLRVTSPLRTAADLALDPANGPLADRTLLTMMSVPGLGCGPASVAAAVEALPYAVGRGRALARITRLERILDSWTSGPLIVPAEGWENADSQEVAGRDPVMR